MKFNLENGKTIEGLRVGNKILQVKKKQGFSAATIAMFEPIAPALPPCLQGLPPQALQPTKSIKFSENWNGKLNCKFFTSIRLSNSYFQAGEYYWVVCKGEVCYRALLVEKRSMRITAIPPYTAYLDTGYSLPDTQKLLQKIYSQKVTDWNAQLLDVILFKNVEFQ